MQNSNTREFIGVVENGHLSSGLRVQIADTMRRMEGKRLAISIKEIKRRRSNNQNRYYWGVVIPIVTNMFLDAGNHTDENEVHEFLKEHVGGLKSVLCDPSGVRHTVVKSSARINTMDFEIYMEKVRALAAGFDIQIPLPNEDK